MKLIAAFFLVALSTLSLAGDTTVSKATPLTVDACEVVANPGRYNGKLVKIRGSFRRTANWSAIEKSTCSDVILVVEPPDPSVQPPADFQIQDDDAYHNFKKFSEALLAGDASDAYEAGRHYKYEVVATFVGRLDSGDVRASSGQMFKARLVLKAVSGVVATQR